MHVICVVTSYALFLVCGVWMMRGSALLSARWVKIAPWITAKVLTLIAYIMLGTIALKRGKTRRVRIAAWLAAQVVFFYIVAVALTHSPLPWPG